MNPSTNLHILGLVSSPSEGTRLAQLLEELHCTAHIVSDLNSAVEAAQGNRLDFLLVTGEKFPAELESMVGTIMGSMGSVRIVLCLKDAPKARWLATKLHGYSLPWPLKTEYLHSVLTGTHILVHEIEPRREVRHRILTHGELSAGEDNTSVLVLNISNHGYMALTEQPRTVGETIALSLRYGVRNYRLSGKIRHVSNNASVSGLAKFDLSLVKGKPQVVGVKFDTESVPASQQLCATIAEERQLMAIRVACIPVIPDFLDTTFQRFRVEPACYENVVDLVPSPQLVLVHLNSRDKQELAGLSKIARKSVVLGVITEPLSDAAAEAAGNCCTGLFVLPHHSQGLTRQIENFLAPIERKFPRIEEDFSAVLTLEHGERVSAAGIEYSLEGCSVTSAQPVPIGSRVRGSLILQGAIRSFSFRGEVVYAQQQRSGYKLGLRYHIDPTALSSYKAFLRKYFNRQLQRQWRLQLAYSAGDSG